MASIRMAELEREKLQATIDAARTSFALKRGYFGEKRQQDTARGTGYLYDVYGEHRTDGDTPLVLRESTKKIGSADDDVS